ncbi:TetR/AcrR family transcriptional regulator [Roseomonas populi]|uniref:TetR/AcrR family transcriptional regulator n=1 Tax=Roseomonas populi TaxID=3121582 RepID=A0ABT1X844_9PROT|nr:TetR/AcrR family transcriptional regulator [Roseomonas pecuniae]MCR0984275.1 TetR/AcrR family transcriptional regulator [Roseomonas pecuniae]
MTTKIPRPRGRPRGFDPEAAVATAQALFQARGYDAVGVADLTAELGINPPSFYAAFGSKAGLYARVLERYGRTGALSLADLLSPDRPVAEGLSDLLEEAARRYAADPDAAGCLALEGRRCQDPAAREAATATAEAGACAIRTFIAARHPDRADALTDYVSTLLSGLSAMARAGVDQPRLLAAARLGAGAVRAALAA